MKFLNGLIVPRYDSNDPTDSNFKGEFGNIGISFCFKSRFLHFPFNINFENKGDGEDFRLITKLLSHIDSFKITRDVYYNVDH